MQTPTIAEIKARTKEKSPFFFSRSTMRLFGQTMRDFKVVKSPKGNIYIYASDKGVKAHTLWQFVGNDLVYIDMGLSFTDTLGPQGLMNMEHYIREH